VQLQPALGDGTRLELAERPFVDDVNVVGVVEKTGSDPGLRKKCRQTSHLMDALTKGEGPLRKEKKKDAHLCTNKNQAQNVLISKTSTAPRYKRLNERTPIITNT
jgi:hypothetical protein